MFSHNADGPLAVHVPSSAQDRPSWTKVGVIAMVGFVIGVSWPKLAGVRLGPSVPEASSAVTAASAPAAGGSAVASGPPAAAPAASLRPRAGEGGEAPSAAAVVPSASAPVANVTVGHAVVFACKTAEGESLKGAECGNLPGLDGVVMPRLRKLAECPDAAGSSGKLHLVTRIDFARSSLTADLGRGHGVASPDALLACVKANLAGASLVGIPHENQRYSVAYTVTFGPPAGGVEPPAAAVAATGAAGADSAEGAVQVVWDVAIVRDAPKTGKVVARLQRGAPLRVGTARDGWYPVKFGDGFASDGWVYRAAIGR